MLTVPSLCLSSPFSDINQYVSDESGITLAEGFDKNDLVEQKGHSTRLNLNRCTLSFKLGKTSANSTERATRRLNLLDAQHVPLNKSRTSYDFYILTQSSLMLMKRSVQLSIHSQYLTAKYKHFESF